MDPKIIKESFNKCDAGRLIGIEVTEVGDGFARGRLSLEKRHMNVFGSVHGGILFSLADQVGGACGNAIRNGALLVESSIHYIKGAREGETVYAEARLTYLGKRLGRVDTRLTNDIGKLIAICHQIFYVKERAYGEG